MNCLQTVGEEPVNFAFVTFSGKSQAAADPLARALDPTHAAHIPDPAQVLQYNPGDLLSVFLHDTPKGFRVDIVDLTTGQSGSMTASIANGFAQINFVPDPDPAHPSVACSSNPYAFHAMYSTSLAAQPPPARSPVLSHLQHHRVSAWRLRLAGGRWEYPRHYQQFWRHLNCGVWPGVVQSLH